jgi:hypothetical protein
VLRDDEEVLHTGLSGADELFPCLLVSRQVVPIACSQRRARMCVQCQTDIVRTSHTGPSQCNHHEYNSVLPAKLELRPPPSYSLSATHQPVILGLPRQIQHTIASYTFHEAVFVPTVEASRPM